MPDAAIALGSNLGSRGSNLSRAVLALGRTGQVLAVSSFHDTAPVGLLDQPRFLNAAALLRTDLAPQDLMLALLEMEREMGRRRDQDIPPKGPRVIDLDLLLYDQVQVQNASLTLPHPVMQDRLFVLEPLAEIAPGWVHPGLRMTVAKMRDRLLGGV